MKKYLLYIPFLLLSAGISFAQDSKIDHKIPRQILTTVAQMPEFPGGNDALVQYLVKNVKYPKKAFKEQVQGTVQARFIVETDGSISGEEIVQTVSEEFDKETLRVIRKMPGWNPGREGGVAVACYFTLPVSFRLK